MNDQKGLSSLVLLFILVLGIALLWEVNQYMNFYSAGGPGDPKNAQVNKGGGTEKTICLTGEEGNCNDTNDQFLLP